jgi:integrase
VFVAQVRVGKVTRRVKIGPYGAFTVDAARQRAEEIIRAAADGRDPQQEKQAAREAITVAALCDEYLAAARAGHVLTRFRRPKSPATVAIDEGRIGRHVKPLIGHLPAKGLTTADMQRLSDSIAQGKTAGVFKTGLRGKAVVSGGAGTAARVVELLGGIWSWGRKRGHVAGASPTLDVDRMRGVSKDRVLSATELTALGSALDESPASMAIRLLALTGWRREEVVGLRWAEIDGQTAKLSTTKTGRSVRPIGKAAIEVLALIPWVDGSDYVFPNRVGNGSADLKKSIAAFFDKAGLADARSHDLRRTFGSVAADMGYSDATIAELLGHARRGVTERHYVRRSDPVMIAAADRVAGQIAGMLNGKLGAVVVSLAAMGRQG